MLLTHMMVSSYSPFPPSKSEMLVFYLYVEGENKRSAVQEVQNREVACTADDEEHQRADTQKVLEGNDSPSFSALLSSIPFSTLS